VMNRNAQVVTILAGAAAFAGVGYALTRRSGGPAVRGRRGTLTAGASVRSPRRAETMPEPAPAPTDDLEMSWDADRISSAPDALDVALNLEGVFDVDSLGVTARPSDHVPAPRTGDDDDAPAPEDLGQAWLTQATESEHGPAAGDTLPDVDQVLQAMEELGEGKDEDGDGIDDDETTAEYVRRHRISSLGLSEDLEKKSV